MNDDVAIKVEKVSKKFLLPHEKKTSIKGVFTSLFGGKTSYTQQHALNDINFEVKKGEFFGIVGRNGSGKSTLLKIIAGIYQPTKGNLQVNGKLVPFIELGVGFNQELTGRENVFLNGSILGFTRKQIQKNYNKIVDFAELHDFMDQKLSNYSSGMQVRLAFACATMAEADILLIDEVLAVGDADFQRKCFNFFKKLKKEGTTVVFVTHDMSAVREYCDKAILINESELVMEEAPEKISEEYIKLFNYDISINDEEKKATRWGNKKIIFKVPPKITITKEQITISVSAEYKSDIESPIFGFRIDNFAGETILGTNSHILQKNIKKFRQGSIVNIEWAFENILGTGSFECSLACIGDDGITVYDWWENAKKFQHTNIHSTPYRVSPRVDLNIGVK